MIAAIYARVSTEYQEAGFSIAAQLKQLQEYCIKNDIEIFKAYVDEGISGRKEDRPQFQAMLKDAEQGHFKLILVHKFDRFARNIELSQKIKKQLHKIKVNVVSITEPIEDSPMGFFVSGLHELMAEYFSKNLGKEVEKGQKERVLQGIPSGSTPLGYKNTKEVIDGKVVKKIEIVPEQAQIVNEIFNMYASGIGIFSIAKHLNYNNIRSKRGGEYDVSAVARLLKNPFFVGKVKYKGELYPSSIPPIISEELFDIVQSRRGDRAESNTYNGNRKQNFLFAGIIRCALCKRTLQIQINKKCKIQYYFCHNAKYIVNNERYCSMTTNFNIEKIEEKIIKRLKWMLAHNKSIEVQQSYDMNEVMQKRKTQLENELKRAKDAYLAEVFTIEEFKEIKDRVEKELSQINFVPIKSINITEAITEMLTKLEASETVAEKKNVLHKYIKGVYVTKTELTIKFNTL